jgi:ABC-type arginine transport system permease subunit
MNTQAINDGVLSYLLANPWLFLLIIWVIVWKLIALWKAAKNDHLTVFIVLALLNLVGIPEIIYIAYLYFRSRKTGQTISQ